MDERTERMYELMRKENNRLKTFQMNPPWPKDYVDIKKLAKAGFFYAFNGDNVHCAFCRGQVCRWDRDDDPMTEHARHFTTCPFIMGGEVGNEPIGEDPFPGPKRPRPYDVCGPFPSYPPTDPRSEEERQVTNDEDGERRQQQEQSRHQAPSQEWPSQHNVEVERYSPPRDRNNNDQQQQQAQESNLILERAPEHYEQSGIPSQNYTEQQGNFIISHNQSNPSVTAPNSLTGICKICYTNSIELVFLPCGHSVSCLSCAQRLFNCPCCRERITTRIRTYLV